jgi:hypothetical protein
MHWLATVVGGDVAQGADGCQFTDSCWQFSWIVRDLEGTELEVWGHGSLGTNYMDIYVSHECLPQDTIRFQ